MFTNILRFRIWNGEEAFTLSFFAKRAFRLEEMLLDRDLLLAEFCMGDFVLILEPPRMLETPPTGPSDV